MFTAKGCSQVSEFSLKVRNLTLNRFPLTTKRHRRSPSLSNSSYPLNVLNSWKHLKQIPSHSIINRFISNSNPPLSQQSSPLEILLDQAQSEKNLIGILAISQQLKLSKPISPDQLKLVYRHLISILGHYGLWTQLYATISNLFESVPIDEIDDLVWSTIIDGFIQCGKSTDAIFSILLSSMNDDNNNNKIEKYTISSLIRAAILESNLSQSIYLLQTAIELDLIQFLDKQLLIQLACLFIEHNQGLLAIDLLHNFVIPFTQTDHPHCFLHLINFLRKSVDQSDPQSTLYCYSYLVNQHPQTIQELIEQDSGLIIQLLNLASRHIKPELTLNILSQLVVKNKQFTSSSNKGKMIQIEHLIPSIICLCRAGGNKMEEVIKILIRIDQDFVLVPQEIELIGFNLFVGHLGGLDQFRNLHNSKDRDRDLLLNEEEIQKSIQSLEESEEICKKLIVNHVNLLKEKTINHDDNQVINPPKALICLINSLIQANLEINRPDKSIEIFQFYFKDSFNQSSTSIPNKIGIQSEDEENNSKFTPINHDSSLFLKPDSFTLSLIKNAADKISNPTIIQSQVLSFIHEFQPHLSDS